MKELPEGKSLGWMQAPLTWIDSHTIRFVGVVRLVIQDGTGFILIKKGKPLYHYFKLGSIELKGHSALDYFNSHPVIDFTLCKYTPEDFAQALKICNINEDEPVIPKEQDIVIPVLKDKKPPAPLKGASITPQAREKSIPDPVMSSPAITSSTPVMSSIPVTSPPDATSSSPVMSSPPVTSSPDVTSLTPIMSSPSPTFSADIPTATENQIAPEPQANDEPDLTIITQIRNMNGIVALSVFNDKENIILMGDADGQGLLKITGRMLETAQKVTPLLTLGSFIHMTLQIPEGNMIIAPYRENYLCLLTTRSVNIGHIRRIIRAVQQKEAPQNVS